MDCILLFSCLFLFFISSLIYLLTSTYFRASFFLFIIFIHLQNIPSLLFYVIVLNTMSVDLAYLLHVIGGGQGEAGGRRWFKKKKKRNELLSVTFFSYLSFFTVKNYGFSHQTFTSIDHCSVRARLLDMADVEQHVNLTKINSVSSNDGIMQLIFLCHPKHVSLNSSCHTVPLPGTYFPILLEDHNLKQLPQKYLL